MSALSAALPAPLQPPALRLGRVFVHPLFDLLVIGGGLSLALTPLFLWGPRATELGQSLELSLPVVLLLVNSAHFAASTVRLYTKPAAMRELPFLTRGFPLLTLLVLTLGIVFVERVGAPLQNLYVAWSPFHYGAQAYGLSLMYAYRSGCSLRDGDKRLLRLTCLLPFTVLLIGGPLLFGSSTAEPRFWVMNVLGWAAFALPPLILLRLYRQQRTLLPLISIAVLFGNGVWLLTLGKVGAFAWATVFHGLQYLGIVTIFHVKDRLQQPGNLHGWAWHTVTFYLTCLALGYLLFEIWPFAYVLMGFGIAESMLLVTALINLHHFIVDAYIWKLRQSPNYRIVTDAV
jgi:hypothetical protein